MVFKSCFADTNKQVDMNKDLKEKIIHETRAYVTRPQLVIFLYYVIGF